jgi:hypothetical protein
MKFRDRGAFTHIPNTNFNFPLQNAGISSAESSKDSKRDVSSRQMPPESETGSISKSQESAGSTLDLQQQGLASQSAGEGALPKIKPGPAPSNTKAAPTKTASAGGASSTASKPTAVTTRDIYESGFSYANPALCPNDGLDIQLFVMIMSAPGHFSARDAIRLTWGHFSQRMDISIAFLIGESLQFYSNVNFI